MEGIIHKKNGIEDLFRKNIIILVNQSVDSLL